MVHIIHEWNGERVEGESSGPCAGMQLLCGNGVFFSCANHSTNTTRYNGLLAMQGAKLVKSVDALLLADIVESVRTAPGLVERRYAGGACETLRLRGETLLYSLADYSGDLFLDLDMRRIDDGDARGRSYALRDSNGTLTFTYTKYKDDALTQRDYALVLIIDGAKPGSFRRIGEWQKRTYAYDARRKDVSEAWIYRAGAIKVDRFLSLRFFLEGASSAKGGDLVPVHSSLPAAIAFASLEGLVSPQGCILAGLPWFAQPWTRDELVSLGAFIAAGRYSFAKAVIMRYVALLEKKDGLDAYYPSGGLPSADAIGWLAKRTHQLLTTLDAKGILDEHFSKRELELLRDRIIGVLHRACEGKPALLRETGPLETWMDTSWGGDVRDGARVEIQALRAAGFSLCHFLNKKTHLLAMWHCRDRRDQFFKEFHDSFYADGALCDGIKDGVRDRTQRPNIFLAYYLAPELLSPDEWRAAFDTALSKLWLPWGGLASIEIGHPLYVARYSGMDNHSYHRGDSWYWVNALAALAMRRLDEERYAEYIEKIIAACVRDLLFTGAIGHSSEISSAETQEWGGCFAQAWSAAALFELLHE